MLRHSFPKIAWMALISLILTFGSTNVSSAAVDRESGAPGDDGRSPEASSGAEQVPLRIDFRDGSSLQALFPDVDLVWRNISKDGKVSERRVPIRDVQKISLVQEPSTARVSNIRQLLTQLGSDDYHQRKEAQIKLVATGKEFEEIIASYVPKDEEAKWRIAEVKEALKEKTGSAVSDSTFDVLELQDGDQPLDGELGPLEFEVAYRDATIKISRLNVATISTEPLQTDFVVGSNAAGGTREQDYPDANGTMPAGMIYESFEQTPTGKKVSTNMDISKAYIDRGLILETSFKDSYVGALNYTFSEGRGGSYSIANVEPTYQGTITLKFCVPGSPLFAAGTRYVGFNVSHVNPNGTFFEAYNAQGQLITRFATDDLGTDYLGFRSEVPIAKVLVRPNLEIDEDFAIDDLFFETPTALLESGNPEFFSIVTRKGERLQGESIEIDGDAVVLNSVSIGVDRLRVDKSDVWVAIPPKGKETTEASEAEESHAYCLLLDGSVVRADMQGPSRLRGGAALDPSRLVAVWGIDQQPAKAPEDDVAKGTGMVFGNDRFYDLANIGFGKSWFRSPSIEPLSKKAANEDDPLNGIQLTNVTYSTSPCVFLRNPVDLPADRGVAYTDDGERYFFADSESVKMTAESVILSDEDETLTIPWNEVQSLRFFKK